MTSTKKWPQPPKLSTYIPFWRWFTNERERELRQTRELYAEVRALHEASEVGEKTPYHIIQVVMDYIEEERELSEALFSSTVDALYGVLIQEPLFSLPEVDLQAGLPLEEHAKLRNQLRRKRAFHQNEEAVLERLLNCLFTVFAGILKTVEDGNSDLFHAPLFQLVPQDIIDKAIGTLNKDQFVHYELFRPVADTVYRNACAYSRIQPDDPKKAPIPIGEAKLGPGELIDTYLADTPFQEFFRTPVPLDVPEETFFEHMHVVGGSGAGKTQWLQTLILHHLAQPHAPALVVVDSQGDLINTFLSRQIAGDLGERLIHITPKDVDYPPAINIFDLPERIEGYDTATKEQIVAGVIDLFDYLFRGLLADLTAKQSVFFRMVARLLLTMPEAMGRNATIMDILHLMEAPEDYRLAIEALPPVHRRFFEQDFHEKQFNQTKEQIRYRINAVIENPTLYRLFTAQHTKVDLFNELQQGSVILVDTAKDFLKSGSAYFGRIFISLVLQSVLERAAVPAGQRHPAFLIVDEAQDYFDTSIDDLLTEARKYRLGTVFAHQYMGQVSQQLRASLAANTAIKLASGVSTQDARSLAPDLRTTPEFILNREKLNFACHIRGVTSSAFNLPLTPGKLEAYPYISDDEARQLQERNRRRVSENANAREQVGTKAPADIPPAESQDDSNPQTSRADPNEDDPTAPTFD